MLCILIVAHLNFGHLKKRITEDVYSTTDRYVADLSVPSIDASKHVRVQLVNRVHVIT